MTTFEKLGLIEPLLRALSEEGYEQPTPIQAQAIPPLLEERDVLGCAQTGTGKTAAFALPVLQILGAEGPPEGKRWISTLVLTPTRELATQIGDSFKAYGRYVDVTHHVVFGGVSEVHQIKALRQGIDVLVATPGRLLDLHGRGFVDLRDVEFFILDEADRMLDMGFIHDVRKVLQHLPKDRQNLLFSATMPPEIVELAGSFLRNPVKIEVTPEAPTVEAIDQSLLFVSRDDKVDLLVHLLQQREVNRSIVFTRTKHGANNLVKKLLRFKIEAQAIHGNKSQGARQRALEGFKGGHVEVLVATDLASRGLDIEEVTHVFNYDLPVEPEVYVHRIGRTGRAGRAGIAVSLCDQTEGDQLRAIERLIRMPIPVVTQHPFHSEAAAALPPSPPRGQGGGGRRGGGGGGSRGGGRGGSGARRGGSGGGRTGGAGGGSRGSRGRRGR